MDKDQERGSEEINNEHGEEPPLLPEQARNEIISALENRANWGLTKTVLSGTFLFACALTFVSEVLTGQPIITGTTISTSAIPLLFKSIHSYRSARNELRYYNAVERNAALIGDLLTEFHGRNCEDIDVKGVETYVQEKGMVVKPAIVLTENDLPLMERILQSHKFPYSADLFASDLHGEFIQTLDLPLVLRRTIDGVYRPALYWELVLLHELVHASEQFRQYYMNKSSDGTEYIGMATYMSEKERSGRNLIEEGLAGYLQAEYYARKYKFLNDYTFLVEASYLEPEASASLQYQYTIPMKYLSSQMRDFHGKPTISLEDKNYGPTSASLAGFILEMLNAANPNIVPTLIRARNEPNLYSLVAAEFNRVDPAMYNFLRTPSFVGLSNSKQREFLFKLAIVIRNRGLNRYFQAVNR